MSSPSYQLRLALIGLYALLSLPALACPGALSLRDLEPMPQGPRHGLRLFALKPGPAGKLVWQHLPFQVDPLTPDGRLLFAPGSDLTQKGLEPNDLFTFQTEDFGQPMLAAAPPLPCRSASVHELKASRGSVAYLAHCPDQADAVAPVHAPRVSFDAAGNTLQSALYRYRFHPENYMQFSSIAFRNERGGWDEVARDSQLLIRADVKHFFTMSFDSEQIQSRLEATRLGPIGNLARLSFYLRILLFKIRMSLATDVGFFGDSGHIPMQVDLPVNAYERLNPASGILYSWRLVGAAASGLQTMHMPRLDPALVHLGFRELAKLGLGYCHGDSCLFRYAVNVRGQQLSMDLDLQRSLVERGFFPLFVDDVRKPAEAMGWSSGEAEEAPRLGMYFEVSGLPEGGHPWDFWLRLGAPEEAQASCPRPITLRRIK